MSQDERGASSGSIRQLRPRVRLNTSREGFVTDPGAIDEAPHRLLGSLSLTAPSDMAFPQLSTLMQPAHFCNRKEDSSAARHALPRVSGQSHSSLSLSLTRACTIH